MINQEYKKWYDRFTKGIATKEKHIDILLEKGVITQEEYDSIIAQSGYVERTEEPVRVPSKVEQLEATIETLTEQISVQDMIVSDLFMEVYGNGVK